MVPVLFCILFFLSLIDGKSDYASFTIFPVMSSGVNTNISVPGPEPSISFWIKVLLIF